MNNRAFHVIVLVLSLMLIAGCYAFTLNDIGMHFFGFKWPLHCLFSHSFSVKCTFCAIIRSLTSTAHGQLSQAIKFNPLGPVLFAFFAFQIPYRIWVLIRFPKGIHPTLSKIHKCAMALTIIAILIYSLLHLPEGLMK